MPQSNHTIKLTKLVDKIQIPDILNLEVNFYA